METMHRNWFPASHAQKSSGLEGERWRSRHRKGGKREQFNNTCQVTKHADATAVENQVVMRSGGRRC